MARPPAFRAANRARARRRTAADEALVRLLFDEHGRALLAYVTRLTGDRAAAEDVVQETLVRAWRHLDALDEGRGSVRGWLFTVARNLVVDRARALAARPTEVAESPSRPPAAGDPAERVGDALTVLHALDALSPERREVLVHQFLEGRTVAETADALSIPPGTVKSRTFYALRELRVVLGDEIPAKAVAS